MSLDADGWDAVQELIGRLAALLPGTVGDIVALLGWSPRPFVSGAELRLADLVDDHRRRSPRGCRSSRSASSGRTALAFLADLFSAAGDVSGAIAGSGHPDDPYRLPIGAGLPEPAVWFPPEGLEPRVTAVPEALAAGGRATRACRRSRSNRHCAPRGRSPPTSPTWSAAGASPPGWRRSPLAGWAATGGSPRRRPHPPASPSSAPAQPPGSCSA